MFHITDNAEGTRIQHVEFMQLFKESTADDVSLTSTFVATPITVDCYTACFEVGPRMTFSTPRCTNVESLCHATGFNNITSIERFRRYRSAAPTPIEDAKLQRLTDPNDIRYDD